MAGSDQFRASLLETYRPLADVAVVVMKCHHARMVRLAMTSIVIGMLVVSTAANAENWQALPKRIAKHCKTPPEWISITRQNEVYLQPPPDADYSKVDCILMELRKRGGIKLGFVGNEVDPNRVLNPSWSYIAGGSVSALTALANEVRKAGWISGGLAKAEDGTGFLTFHTPEGMTEAQATPFAERLWKHELGDITFGHAPSRSGSSFNGD